MSYSKYKTRVARSAIANAVANQVKNESSVENRQVAEQMFSMESLFSQENPSAFGDSLNAVKAKTSELSGDIFDGLRNNILEDLGQLQGGDVDESAATVEAVEQMLGKASLSGLQGAEKEAKAEELLKEAANRMAEASVLMAGEKKDVDANLSKLRSTDFGTNALLDSTGTYSFDSEGHKEAGFSMESFDTFDPDKHSSISVMLSALSVVEDPIVRMTYPTYRLPAGDNVVRLTVDRTFVEGNDARRTNGDGFQRQDIELTEAYYRTDIFQDDRIDCIPVVSDDTKEKFADATLFGNVAKKDELGDSYQTRLLAFGKEVDLIAISSGRGEIKHRRSDRTDQLDPAFKLKNIGVVIGDGTETEGFNVYVKQHPSAMRVLRPQSNGRTFNINFSEEVHVQLDGIKTAKGESSKVLKDLISEGYSHLTLKIDANFTGIDLTEATVTPNAVIRVSGVRKDGVGFPADDPAVKPLLDALSVSEGGYELDARRTDSNYSNTGKRLTSRPESREYAVGFSPAVTCRTPIGATDLDNAQLLDKAKAAITREKVINALSDKFERLEAVTGGGQGVVKDLGAYQSNAFATLIGVRPTLWKDTYTPEETKSNKHRDRIADVNGHVVNILRNLCTHAVKDSRLDVLAKDINRGEGTIKVNMICDPLAHQLLIESGDERLLGDAFNSFEIESDHAEFFKNRIVGVFEVESPGDVTVLGNGFTATGVSPVVKFDPDQSNGAKVQTILTAPRQLVQDVNEVMFVLEIEDLEKLMEIK